jgi:hypothetical protein
MIVRETMAKLSERIIKPDFPTTALADSPNEWRGAARNTGECSDAIDNGVGFP